MRVYEVNSKVSRKVAKPTAMRAVLGTDWIGLTALLLKRLPDGGFGLFSAFIDFRQKVVVNATQRSLSAKSYTTQ
jgi:hypothetical protein